MDFTKLNVDLPKLDDMLPDVSSLEVKDIYTLSKEAQSVLDEALSEKRQGEENERNLIKKQLEDYVQNVKDVKDGLRISQDSKAIAIAALIVSILSLVLAALL